MNTLIYRKSLIALTGLFLCLFLIVHLSANLILLLPPETAQGVYNEYSTFLRESPLIAIIAYLLYLSLLLHIVYAALVTYRNRKSRPEGYKLNRPLENSTWASQNMGWLGMLILIFLVIHLVNFWSRIKLEIGDPVGTDPGGFLDVYSVTYALFQNPFYVAFYTVLMIPLGYHLHHGLKSSFKTLGFHSQKGLRILSKVSLIYALVMAIGFAVIPIIVFLR
ncbi:MAG TPA: succinate dehydrogenase cytochrome b subunit [Cryomorphaceae bacterium]|nr:succinate dehydrogenase cytochrome b subunit [Cryomorphaceae bacterium]